MKNIVCFHLFNDYSGSPKVLKMVLEGFLKRDVLVNLITSKGGVLDEIENVNLKRHCYWYSFSGNSVLIALKYTIVQLYTFIIAFQFLFRKNTVFYVNTLLPVAPALAGRLMGKKVIYHYHENAFIKGLLYKILAWCMQRLAHKIICVSQYQASFLKRKTDVVVIPNSLPKEFKYKLNIDLKGAYKQQTVLMLSSLKEYKGTCDFIELAAQLPQYKFILVINDTQESIDKYFKGKSLALEDNITIYSRQDNVSKFYNSASLVINLSDKNLFIETFGLTALEAMSAGLPVIVPTVGGIAEMVEDGVNGYKIDVQNISEIAECIQRVLSDKELYMSLSKNALTYSCRYDEHTMIDGIMGILQKN